MNHLPRGFAYGLLHWLEAKYGSMAAKVSTDGLHDVQCIAQHCQTSRAHDKSIANTTCDVHRAQTNESSRDSRIITTITIQMNGIAGQSVVASTATALVNANDNDETRQSIAVDCK